MKNERIIKFLGLTLIFSVILFGIIASIFNTDRPTTDFLLSILVVSYILKTVYIDKI